MALFLILVLLIVSHLIAMDGMKLRLEGRVQQRHLLTGTLGNLEEASKKLTALIHAINLAKIWIDYYAVIVIKNYYQVDINAPA